MNGRTVWALWLLLVAFAASAVLTVGFGIIPNHSMTGAALNPEDLVTIPISDVSETARFYEYGYGGKTIRFFAVMANDGSVKTGFDACDVCYYSGKGYRQEGSDMVCNNCGNRYPISGLGKENTNPGGCWPGYLPSTVEGNSVIIKKSDLADGSWRF